jgi:hypothetical protein
MCSIGNHCLVQTNNPSVVVGVVHALVAGLVVEAVDVTAAAAAVVVDAAVATVEPVVSFSREKEID